jgi:hypothetical protein
VYTNYNLSTQEKSAKIPSPLDAISTFTTSNSTRKGHVKVWNHKLKKLKVRNTFDLVIKSKKNADWGIIYFRDIGHGCCELPYSLLK